MGFEEYVEQKSPLLQRVAYLLTRDAHVAEDLVQSVLLEVYRKWSKVSRAHDVDAYVRRMLVNKYLDWTRRRSWREQPVADELLFAAGGTAEEASAGVLDAERMRELVQGLPPRARAVLVLRYYLDLDDATIADYTSVTPSTVRATASRALAVLRTRQEPASKKE